jgi:hypothetical protein
LYATLCRFQALLIIVLSSARAFQTPILGVCLGLHKGHFIFYTSTGHYSTDLQYLSNSISVNSFMTPNELQPLVDAIPELADLQTLVPPPEAGRPVFDKMAGFLAQADAVHRDNMATFDNVSNLLGDSARRKFLPLDTIAQVLLPPALKTDGRFSAAALYAVHRAMLSDDYAVSPLRGAFQSYTYDITSIQDVRTVKNIEVMFHQLIELAGKPESSRASLLAVNALGRFIQKARSAVQKNRTRRGHSTVGVLSPERSEKGVPLPEWNADDLEALRFLYMWACQSRFPKTTHLNAIGSGILRFIGLYNDVQFLDGNAGFTLLQELGWIAPWDLRVRHSYQQPGTVVSRHGSLIRQEWEFGEFAREDIAKNYRHDWGSLKAYVIDNVGTLVKDDGISLEPTDKAGEYWVRIHVADPTSRLPHDTRLAKDAQNVFSSSYVPWHSFGLFWDEEVARNFSLGPGKLCLTLSALVNEQGDMLDYDIRPARIRNVVHTTHDQVVSIVPKLSVVEEEPESAGSGVTIEVGKAEPPLPMGEDIITAEKFSKAEKDELNALARLGAALRRRRFETGMEEFRQTGQPSQVHVGFENTTQVPSGTHVRRSTVWKGDPYITIQSAGAGKAPDRDYVVEEAMVLAGRVAAKWANDRRIPIFHHSTPDANQNAEHIKKFISEYAIPAMRDRSNFVRERGLHVATLRKLIGSPGVTLDPEPYFNMGVDMYSKVTSPLRRYVDLVAHWQIHSALAEEHRLGRSLSGEDCSAADFLPFSRGDLNKMLPDIIHRNTIHGAIERNANKEWIRQGLIRAHHFKEAKLPSTFTFTVVDSSRVQGVPALDGSLDLFEQEGRMFVEDMDGFGRIRDVEVGDQFEVRINEIRPEVGVPIRVVPVRKLEPEAPLARSSLTVAIE